MEQTEKPIINRVLACFCAILICCLVVFVGFSIPKVSAEGSTFSDQYETYIDTVYSGTGGASLGGGSVGSIIDGLQMGIDYAIWCLENPMPIGGSVNLDTIHSMVGYYYVNGDPNQHVARCAFADNYFPSDGLDFVTSDTYNLHVVAVSTSAYQMNVGFGFSGSQAYPYIYMSSASATQSWDALDNKGFYTYGWIGATMPGTNGYCRTWCANIIPTLTAGTNVDHALRVSSRGSDNPAAYPFGNAYLSSVKQFSDIPALSNYTLTLDNVQDFYQDVFVPYIEEDYPEYVQYLFQYVEPSTETPSGGCGCHVDVYVEPTVIVNVEPTIIVDNNIEFPSDWNTEYTYPSIPAHETIPFPTQDSSNTEPVTMPTMDVDEYKQAYGNAIEFWFFVAHEFIEKMGLELLTTFAFVITVVGFVIWKLGGSGGGKND